MKERLKKIREIEKKVIVGIETGNIPGRPGAAIVEVEGNGADTVLDLHHFRSIPLQGDLLKAVRSLEKGAEFDREDITGISFLLMHSLSNLFQTVLDDIEAEPSDVDLIGLKRLEVKDWGLPLDLTAFSEMTGCIVASNFGVAAGIDNMDLLPVSEQLLQGMVDDMVDKFGLRNEVREAVAIALLANESLFHDRSESRKLNEKQSKESGRLSLQTIKSTGNKRRSYLRGEFFFPA